MQVPQYMRVPVSPVLIPRGQCVSFPEWVVGLCRKEEYQSVSRASAMAHTTTFNAYARLQRQTSVSIFRIRGLIMDDENGVGVSASTVERVYEQPLGVLGDEVHV